MTSPTLSPSPATDTLSPTPRTIVNRGRDRVLVERTALHALLDEALVAHLGLDAGGHPVVVPTAFAYDPAGPDDGGSLYVHGSVGAGWLRRSPDATLCVTITLLDGLVAGRSAFHHSMNYRSAVVIGAARLVDEPVERQHALDLIVDHMIPGRSVMLRPSTRKELAATAVLALPLREASMKARAGGPGDGPRRRGESPRPIPLTSQLITRISGVSDRRWLVGEGVSPFSNRCSRLSAKIGP